MATKNRSQPISETFEQIVYSSTSVTGYQTNNLVNNSFYYCFLSVFFYNILLPNIPIQVKNAMPFPRVSCLIVHGKKPKCISIIFPAGGCFKFSLILKYLI